MWVSSGDRRHNMKVPHTRFRITFPYQYGSLSSLTVKKCTVAKVPSRNVAQTSWNGPYEYAIYPWRPPVNLSSFKQMDHKPYQIWCVNLKNKQTNMYFHTSIILCAVLRLITSCYTSQEHWHFSDGHLPQSAYSWSGRTLDVGRCDKHTLSPDSETAGWKESSVGIFSNLTSSVWSRHEWVWHSELQLPTRKEKGV